jgi:hypothetical protein
MAGGTNASTARLSSEPWSANAKAKDFCQGKRKTGPGNLPGPRFKTEVSLDSADAFIDGATNGGGKKLTTTSVRSVQAGLFR